MAFLSLWRCVMSRYTLLCFSDNERYNGSSLSKQRDYFLALPSWVNRRQGRRKRDLFLIIGSDTGGGAARGGGRGQSVGIITFLQLTLAFLGRCLSKNLQISTKIPISLRLKRALWNIRLSTNTRFLHFTTEGTVHGLSGQINSKSYDVIICTIFGEFSQGSQGGSF